MKPALYWARDISPRHEAKMRAYLIEQGATIVKERMQPLLSGDWVQFHIRTPEGEYWFANPQVPLDSRNGSGGYQWFRSEASNYVEA